MRHHSYSLPKKMKFPKFADIRTYGRTYGRKKKVTPKDPLRINARDLKTELKNRDTVKLYGRNYRKTTSDERLTN